MTKFLIEETPAKVLSLLAGALVSMSLLLGVSYSNASLHAMEYPLPDPFAPAKVVASIDSATSAYSSFVSKYLLEPARADYAYYQDSARWVLDNSSGPILKYTGLSELASVEYYQALDMAQHAPRVAGAYVEKSPRKGFSIDTIYSLLVK